MTRRFIGLFVTLALGLLMAPLAAHGQPGAKIPRVGLLQQGPFWEAFRDGLRQLGYIEGQNIAIEYGWAEGSTEPLAELVLALLRRNVDVIVTYGTPATQAAKHATGT